MVLSKCVSLRFPLNMTDGWTDGRVGLYRVLYLAYSTVSCHLVLPDFDGKEMATIDQKQQSFQFCHQPYKIFLVFFFNSEEVSVPKHVVLWDV